VERKSGAIGLLAEDASDLFFRVDANDLNLPLTTAADFNQYHGERSDGKVFEMLLSY
jgi:hypothetical protein